MPYKSVAQEKYFNANRAKLEAQGVNVDEWNQASKGKKLPERASGSKDGKPVKDAKGNVKQNCKEVKQHKKLEVEPTQGKK